MAPMVVFHVLFLCLVQSSAHSKGLTTPLAPRQGQGFGLEQHGPADMLAELEKLDMKAVHGDESIYRERVGEFEARLRQIFNLAPKDAMGRVDAKTARYALQRVFQDRHAWLVNGIADMVTERNSSMIDEVLDSGVHFKLRDLARFAATLEALVYAENEERLQKVFEFYGYSKDAPKTESDAQKITEAFFAMYLMHHANYTSPMGARQSLKLVSKLYPTWAEQKAFAEGVRKEVFSNGEASQSSSLWFSSLKAVQEVSERYGRWQNKYCTEMQDALLDMAVPGTGRVPLSKYWGSMLSGGEWTFSESEALLRQTGALEGSYPNEVVRIPNYVYSSANCLQLSRYYDVCCVNECDTLLGDIEAQVDSSLVAPKRLADMVESARLRTMSDQVKLTPALRQRLEDIAALHKGFVPLHSRSFAQFLHHTFPNDCPFPLTGDPVPRNEWVSLQQAEAYVDLKVAKAYVDEHGNVKSEDAVPLASDLPWTDEEEYFMSSLEVYHEFVDTEANPEGVSKKWVIMPMVVIAAVLSKYSAMFSSGSKASSKEFYV
eukprot:TRINITY_DN593_c0_g1_i6.p1 TRINITY_DN593_c0_g1~~TRINITY_DN593_c0_g1_i6.p1  ORF type:complete len:546 (+),score=113.58 TRINITY_DN593_c0_g1_i6:157-1794(+)